MTFCLTHYVLQQVVFYLFTQNASHLLSLVSVEFLNCAVFWQNFTLQLVETFCGLWTRERLIMGRAESRSSFCWRCLLPLPPGTRSPWAFLSQWFEALACRSRRCPSSKALSGGGSDGSRKSGLWPAASGTPNAWPKHRCFPMHVIYTHHQTF